MKIKKIAAIVNERKKLYLYHGKDAQWIGTGDAMYPIYNLPHMDINQFSKVLDVPQEVKAKQKYFLRELDPGTLDYVDYDLSSVKPLETNRWIFKGVSDYIPLCTSQGLMFLDSKFLGPIDNLDMCTINECHNEDTDHHYILVKDGMFIAAVIEPSRHVLDKEVSDELARMLFAIQIGTYAKMADWLKRNSPDKEDMEDDEDESNDGQAMLEGPPAQLLLGAPAKSVEPQPGPDNSQYMPEVCQRCRWVVAAPEEGPDPCNTCVFEVGKGPTNFVPREEAQAG